MAETLKLFGLTRDQCQSVEIVQRFNTKDVNGFIPQDKWSQFSGLAFQLAGEAEGKERQIVALTQRIDIYREVLDIPAAELAGRMGEWREALEAEQAKEVAARDGALIATLNLKRTIGGKILPIIEEKNASAEELARATEEFEQQKAELERQLESLTAENAMIREVLAVPPEELEGQMTAWAEALRLETEKGVDEKDEALIAEMTLRTQVGKTILPLVKEKDEAAEELRLAKEKIAEEKAAAVLGVQRKLEELTVTLEDAMRQAKVREGDFTRQIEELQRQAEEAARAHEAALRLKDEEIARVKREAAERQEELQQRIDEQAARIKELETVVPGGIIKAVARSTFGREDADVRELPDAIDRLRQENARLKGRLEQIYDLVHIPKAAGDAFDRLVALIGSVGQILIAFGYDATQPWDGEAAGLRADAAELGRKAGGYDAVAQERNRYRGERDARKLERNAARAQVNQLRAEQRSWTSFFVNGVKLGFSTPGRLTGFFLDVING
ncbi:MAG: hypothetical protein KDK64_02755 [Chlamydiia bacterium]|nr:hypothetical protein [Chlamydiia bacterium]